MFSLLFVFHRSITRLDVYVEEITQKIATFYSHTSPKIVQRIPSSNMPKREAATTKDSVSVFPLSGLEVFFHILYNISQYQYRIQQSTTCAWVEIRVRRDAKNIAQYQNSSARSHTVAFVVRYSLAVFEANIWFFGKNTITQCSVLIIISGLKWIGMFYFKLFSRCSRALCWFFFV